MKAVVYTEFGPPEVLKINEVPKPVPKDNEILVKIKASSINYGDLLARNFKNIPVSKFNMPLILWFPTRIFFGLNRPNIQTPGSEFAGNVEAAGKNVKRFKEGDAVFGYRGQHMGAQTEYLCVPENSVVAHKPSNLTYEESSVIPYGGTTALHLLSTANVQPGQKVLINGASGSIGSFAVQIAKSKGATVTGVCGTPRVDFVKALGADHVIDYRKEDFSKNGQVYDLIFDILGKSTFSDSGNSLSEKGIYLRASFKTRELLQMLTTSLGSGKKVICSLTPEKFENLETIKELAEAGKIKPVIDKVFPMDQVAQAHKYVEEDHKKGSIVLAI
ncbi:MAG: NAD(P)-dependent alcohol dehydrogenase [Calditrichaeota bacterium]|nr:NAD(P)-dependent alcohol dehydrogenase [Calditrichota bacterium]